MKYHSLDGKHPTLDNRPISPKSFLEHEKKIRREIANSNERRRMRGINAGYQSLRALLPVRDGEKLSKAEILQSTADYVLQLEQDKAKLLEHNKELNKIVVHSPENVQQCSDVICSASPLPKRMKLESADSFDEGIGSSSPSRSEHGSDEDVKRELIDLKIQLDHEKTVRGIMEQRLKDLESRLSSISGSYNINHTQYGSEDIEKCPLPMNLDQESTQGCSQSPISKQDLESCQEAPLQGSEPPNVDLPELLSVKSNQFPSVELLTKSNVASVIVIASDISRESFPVETGVISLQTEYKTSTSRPQLEQSSYKASTSRPQLEQSNYKASTSRQSLKTIVEAIRYVEGDHMFRDEPVESELTNLNEQPNGMVIQS